jgi:ribosomal protein L11 methyltransferase
MSVAPQGRGRGGGADGAVFSRCALAVAAERYDVAVSQLIDLGVGGWEEDVDVEAARAAGSWATGLVAAQPDRPSAPANEAGASVRTLTFWIRSDLPCVGTAARLAALRELGDLTCVTQDPGWRDAWQCFHEPVTVAGVTVRPPWRPPVGGTLDVVVEIGLAFGTGGHATTRGCLQALADLERGSVLDLGTGTGVLALAALRLGHKPVSAIDDDPEALAQARANAERNGLDLPLALVDCRDSEARLPDAEIVVANIALAPILALGERYSRPRDDGGQDPRSLVLAGLLQEQVPAAEAAFRGYRRRDLLLDGEWALLILEPS